MKNINVVVMGMIIGFNIMFMVLEYMGIYVPERTNLNIFLNYLSNILLAVAIIWLANKRRR